MDTIGKLWYGSRRLEILLLAVDIRGDSVATRATKTCGSFVRPCRQSMWQLVPNGGKILSTYLTEHQKLYYILSYVDMPSFGTKLTAPPCFFSYICF